MPVVPAAATVSCSDTAFVIAVKHCTAASDPLLWPHADLTGFGVWASALYRLTNLPLASLLRNHWTFDAPERPKVKNNELQETSQRETTITTAEPVGKSSSPRQPNEHDASPDSQASAPRADMQQAAIDVASGQVNTDLYGQPARNPKNNAPSSPSPKSRHTLPDGREK